MAAKDRTYGYIRVSTEEQAKKDHVSLPEQKKRIGAICQARANDGWGTLKGFFGDEGRSGDDISRDGLWKMFEAVAAKRVNRIVVLYRDRLMRDAGYLKSTLKFFSALQVELFAGDMGLIISEANDYNADLAIKLLGSVDEYLLESIRFKVKNALSYLKEKGVRLGKPPAGFYRANKKGAIKPTKQGLSIEALSETLSPGEIARLKRFKVLKGKHKGKLLRVGQVERIIRNLRDWRAETLDDRLATETAAMWIRYKEAQIRKVKKQEAFEDRLRAMIPPEAKIRGSRL